MLETWVGWNICSSLAQSRIATAWESDSGITKSWWDPASVESCGCIFPRNTPTKPTKTRTLWKITMELNNRGLEDDVPFQLGDFSGSMWIFQGENPKQAPKNWRLMEGKKNCHVFFWDSFLSCKQPTCSSQLLDIHGSKSQANDIV